MTRLCALVLCCAIVMFIGCTIAIRLDSPVVGIWLFCVGICAVVIGLYMHVNAVICPRKGE